jgi:hypothetical protein
MSKSAASFKVPEVSETTGGRGGVVPVVSLFFLQEQIKNNDTVRQ